MGKYGEIARQNFSSGYNCAQSVLLAFKDKLDLTEEQILRVSSGFGAGMGRMREVCGTVSGMIMAAGLILGENVETSAGKSRQYEITQDLALKFKEKNGSIICRELLSGVNVVKDSGEPYKKRACSDLCYDAADILEEYLDSQNN